MFPYTLSLISVDLQSFYIENGISSAFSSMEQQNNNNSQTMTRILKQMTAFHVHLLLLLFLIWIFFFSVYLLFSTCIFFYSCDMIHTEIYGEFTRRVCMHIKSSTVHIKYQKYSQYLEWIFCVLTYFFSFHLFVCLFLILCVCFFFVVTTKQVHYMYELGFTIHHISYDIEITLRHSL